MSGVAVGPSDTITISIKSMQGINSQSVISDSVKLILYDADNRPCIRSTKTVQVIYSTSNITGEIDFMNLERGLNSSVLIGLSLHDSMVQKADMALDLYWPQEISQFLKMEFPANFSQQVRFHLGSSSGLGSSAELEYSPISDNTGNLRYRLSASPPTSQLFIEKNILVILSTFIPIDISDRLADSYGTVSYRGSPVSQFSLKGPTIPDVGLETEQSSGTLKSGDLDLRLFSNSSLPSRFTLIIKTSTPNMVAFKNSDSSSSCLDIGNVSNPVAKCNQTIKYLNGTLVPHNTKMDPEVSMYTEIRLENPLAGLKLPIGQLRREIALKVHNLEFKYDYMPSLIEIKVRLLTYTKGPELAQAGPEITVKVTTECPKTCTSCSSANPTVCYKCVPGIAIQDKTCWLPMARYNAFFSLRMIINGLVGLLMIILGVHCYLSIMAAPKESRWGLNYLTDCKMATSLLSLVHSLGVFGYSMVAENWLMVWASLASFLVQASANITMYFWIKKQHDCRLC